MEIVLAIIGSGALSALISGFFTLIQNAQNNKQKKSEVTAESIAAVTKDMETLKAGVMQLLYDRLKCLCKTHLKRGYIVTNDLDDLDDMHKIYKQLGGDGFLDDLMTNVKKLPVKPVFADDLKEVSSL